jgi:DNA-binding response OmpR family regulator
MAKRRILVVEDDKAIRQGIVDALAFDGYDVLEAKDGKQGTQMALRFDYDLLLLDLILPKGDGLEILEAVRAGRPTQPVIILTARGEEQDRIKGLELGADDYVVKPFSVKELLARIQAVLRRSPERPTDVTEVEFKGGVVDLTKGEVKFADGGQTELSVREGELLRYLASSAGRVISRDELLSRVWRLTPSRVDTRTIDVHVARLREQLRDHPHKPRLIQTVRGKGYMFSKEES